MRILNVADPTNPFEVGSYHGTPTVVAVALDGDRAYLSCSNAGLRVLDISDPTLPREIGQDLSLVGRYGLAVRGNYLFAADIAGLRVYDISNPAQPIQVAEFLQYFNTDSLAIRGNTVFLTGRIGLSLLAIDITDPEFPTVLGDLDTIPLDSVTIGGKWLFVVAGHYGLMAVDVSSPESPAIVGSFDEFGYSHDVEIHEGHAYLTTGYDDVRVLDTSDFSNPQQVGAYPVNRSTFGIALRGDLAFVAASDEGLLILDVSKPAAPTTLASISNVTAFDVVVRGDLVFQADQWDGLNIFDVSAPSSPQLLGNYSPQENSGWNCRDINFIGDFVFLTQMGIGVHVIDVQDPAFPKLSQTLNGSEYYGKVEISGKLAYIPAGPDGVEIYDISDPSAPVLVRAIPLDGHANEIAVGYPYAYVADGQNGLTVLDITDPTHPLMIGTFEISSGLEKVTFAEGLIWAVGPETGLWILRHDPISAVPAVPGSGTATLHAAYPNPFNSLTTIGFHLARPAIHQPWRLLSGWPAYCQLGGRDAGSWTSPGCLGRQR